MFKSAIVSFVILASASSAFAAADVNAGYTSKVNGTNLQVDMIFVNRGPDIAKRVAYKASLARGLVGVKCEIGHNQVSGPASYDSASGTVAFKVSGTELKDDEAYVVRCYIPCAQKMDLSSMAMSALNAGKNTDGVDRPNSAKLTQGYNICH